MSLYDRLTNKIGDDDEPSRGLTPLDIADLPAPQRKVMFSLLRDTKAATEGISIEQLSENLGKPENLPDTIAALMKSGWLIEIGEENRRYKVNIRRKRGSSLGFGIWTSLSDRITQKMSEFDVDDVPARKTQLPKTLSDQSDKSPNE